MFGWKIECFLILNNFRLKAIWIFYWKEHFMGGIIRFIWILSMIGKIENRYWYLESVLAQFFLSKISIRKYLMYKLMFKNIKSSSWDFRHVFDHFKGVLKWKNYGHFKFWNRWIEIMKNIVGGSLGPFAGFRIHIWLEERSFNGIYLYFLIF